jgi:hypothetical protein
MHRAEPAPSMTADVNRLNAGGSPPRPTTPSQYTRLDSDERTERNLRNGIREEHSAGRHGHHGTTGAQALTA